MLRRRTQLHQSSEVGYKKPADFSLLITAIILVILGLIMVYDASVIHAYKDFNDKYYYVRNQAMWVGLGFFCLFFFSKFNYHFLKIFALPIFLVSILMLLAVHIPGLGVDAGGAHRWLNLGFVSIQPAEIVKLTTIIFFATLFDRQSLTLRDKKMPLMPFFISVILITGVLGILQKDLGSAIVFFLTMVGFYVVSGAPLKPILYGAPIAAMVSFLLVIFYPHRIARVKSFIDPFSDTQGQSYHIAQVLIALGSGGITGMGIGQSRQKFEYIPEVTTDSIFAIVGEELGFFGSVFLIALLSFLVFRGFKIAENAGDSFGKLLAYGLTMWIGIQTIVNLGAMVSLIPLTGVPLPFISYGGSALLVNLVAVGILANISKSAKV
jgi:cell division protein FtsW